MYRIVKATGALATGAPLTTVHVLASASPAAGHARGETTLGYARAIAER